MNVHCMSRAEAQKLFRKMPAETKFNWACISITDTWGPVTPREILPPETIQLSFDDVDPRIEKVGHMQEPMRDSQADNIVRFVRRVNNDPEITDLAIHCEAGMSRSPAIAAAIEEWFGERAILQACARKKPNQWCYRLMRLAFERAPFTVVSDRLAECKNWWISDHQLTVDPNKSLEDNLKTIMEVLINCNENGKPARNIKQNI